MLNSEFHKFSYLHIAFEREFIPLKIPLKLKYLGLFVCKGSSFSGEYLSKFGYCCIELKENVASLSCVCCIKLLVISGSSDTQDLVRKYSVCGHLSPV